MNENKKIIVIITLIVVAILAAIGISYVQKEEERKAMEKYTKLIQSKETKILYLGRPGCSYCQQFTPILEELKGEYKFKYDYINTDDLSASNLSKLLKMIEVEEASFGTPHIAIVKDKKVLGSQAGYTDKEGLFKFFQEHGIIAEDAVLKTGDENLTKIDYNRYKELISEENHEKSIIVLGQTGCSACNSAKPVLSDIAGEKKIAIHYLNITDLNEEDGLALTESFEELGEDFGTPYTMIVQDGKIVSTQQGYLDKDSFISFFQEHGIFE